MAERGLNGDVAPRSQRRIADHRFRRPGTLARCFPAAALALAQGISGCAARRSRGHSEDARRGLRRHPGVRSPLRRIRAIRGAAAIKSPHLSRYDFAEVLQSRHFGRQVAEGTAAIIHLHPMIEVILIFYSYVRVWFRKAL